mmetsp:Transcript_54713/g.175503  ORF Transcript_54713/g.175503 Transcript_54713/m.175503 type:complete len:279 (+) Transcript_54713:1050-1886(+)
MHFAQKALTSAPGGGVAKPAQGLAQLLRRELQPGPALLAVLPQAALELRHVRPWQSLVRAVGVHQAPELWQAADGAYSLHWPQPQARPGNAGRWLLGRQQAGILRSIGHGLSVWQVAQHPEEDLELFPPAETTAAASGLGHGLHETPSLALPHLAHGHHELVPREAFAAARADLCSECRRLLGADGGMAKPAQEAVQISRVHEAASARLPIFELGESPVQLLRQPPGETFASAEQLSGPLALAEDQALGAPDVHLPRDLLHRVLRDAHAARGQQAAQL